MEEYFSRLLIFRGSLQDHGNIWAIESNESIILLGVGKDIIDRGIFDSFETNIRYLEKKVDKIKAICLNNSLIKNCGNLQNIYIKLNLNENNIPIYCSEKTKKILKYLNLINNNIKDQKSFVEVEKNIKILKNNTEGLILDDFEVFFSPINSYSTGNLAFSLHHKKTDSSFYYFDDFNFNTLIDSKSLFSTPLFPINFKYFLKPKTKNIYLISGVQNLNFTNNIHLCFIDTQIINEVENTNIPVLFIVYNFDWNRINEILEMAKKRNKRVVIIGYNFFKLIKSLFSIIKSLKIEWYKEEKIENDCIYIFGSSFDNILEEFKSYNFLEKPKENKFIIISSLFSSSGNENKLGDLFDYLYSIHFKKDENKDEIINLSRREGITLGINLFEIKSIIDNLSPRIVFTLQNSYKHKEKIDIIQRNTKIKRLNDQFFFDVKNEIEKELENESGFMNIEDILISQRNNLLSNGLLLTMIFSKWSEEELIIRKIEILPVAIFESIDEKRIERKIKTVFESFKGKIKGIKSKDVVGDKMIKQLLERKLINSLRLYSNNPMVMIFIEGEKKESMEENEGTIN